MKLVSNLNRMVFKMSENIEIKIMISIDIISGENHWRYTKNYQKVKEYTKSCLQS